MRGWRFSRGGGDHDEKPVSEAYSRQYNPYFFVFVEKKEKSRRDGGRRIAYCWIRHCAEEPDQIDFVGELQKKEKLIKYMYINNVHALLKVGQTTIIDNPTRIIFRFK